MNIKQAKQVFTIPQVLEWFGFMPAKIAGNKTFYYAIDGRKEKTASLLVSQQEAFDFGSSKSYDVISIIQEIQKCSVKEALGFLKNQTLKSNFTFENKNEILNEKSSSKIKIISVNNEFNFSLKKYLLGRKISEKNFKYLKQVDFVSGSNNTQFYAIGFKNNSGTFDLRSKIFKGCTGKDITTIVNNNSTINIFESCWDFLSFLELFNSPEEDFLILNSNSMIKKAEVFLKSSKYKKIKIFTDSDFSGNEACQFFLNNFNCATDERKILSQDGKIFKDLNDLLCNIPQD